MNEVELLRLQPDTGEREDEPGERAAAFSRLQHLHNADGDDRHRPEAQVVDGRCEPELVEAEDDANENDEESDDELRGDAKSGRGGGGLQLDHD